jgi:hypothetical protein
LSALVIRPLLGCPITVNDNPAGTMHVALNGVADKIRGIVAAALSPDRDMIANNDHGDVMPLTPAAERHAAIREMVKQRHAETLRAAIAAAHWIGHSECPRRQEP